MALLYLAAGVNHFIHARTYLRMMPPRIPYPYAMVMISGIIEILLALLIMLPATRRVAAWLIIALLIAVFPANIQMAVDFYHAQHAYLWLAIARLPVQGLLIWWAWIYTRR